MDTNAVSDGTLPSLLAPATTRYFGKIDASRGSPKKFRAWLPAITRVIRAAWAGLSDNSSYVSGICRVAWLKAAWSYEAA
jgi:hypothetical protein